MHYTASIEKWFNKQVILVRGVKIDTVIFLYIL